MKAFKRGCLLTIGTALTAFCLFATPLSAQDAAAAPEPANVSEQLASTAAALQKDNENLVEAIRAQRSGMERAIEEGNLQAQKDIAAMHGTLRITAYAVSAIGAVGAILSLVILLKLSRATPAANESHGAATPLPQQTTNPALTAALARIEERLNALAKAVQTPAKQPSDSATPNREVMERLDALETTLRSLAEKKPADPPADASPVADVFWPKAVRNQENYPAWRKALADALNDSRPEAQQFSASLLAFQSLAARRDLTNEVAADFLRELSRNLYNYCYSTDAANEDDRLDVVSALFRAVKEEIQLRAPSIEIKAFHPNDRLNTDLMEKVDTGSRLTVSKPLSWLIIDRTGGRERILHRAQVITG